MHMLAKASWITRGAYGIWHMAYGIWQFCRIAHVLPIVKSPQGRHFTLLADSSRWLTDACKLIHHKNQMRPASYHHTGRTPTSTLIDMNPLLLI